MTAHAATLLLGLLLGGDNNLTKVDLQALQGEWRTLSLEINGTKIGEDFSKDRLIIKDHRFEMKTAKDTMIGTVTLNATKDPKHIDTQISAGANKGLKSIGIYYLAGNRLMVCYCVAPNPRPTEFRTSEKTARAMVMYRRQSRSDRYAAKVARTTTSPPGCQSNSIRSVVARLAGAAPASPAAAAAPWPCRWRPPD